jgi:hypothetical protein
MLALALVSAGLWSGLHWFEKINIFSPSREFSIIPGTFGLAHEEAALTTEDGVRLHGWFLPRTPGRGPLAARGLVLLLCHGNAGNISHRMHKAALLHRLGLNILLFDYRGYGKSAGSPSEAGTYSDAQAAYRYLIETKGFPPERIIIYGESLGNAVAVETALRQPPRALILESAFTSIADMGREIFPRLPLRWLIRTRYDNLSKIPRLRCPVLVMHSRQDRIVPFRMGQALFAAAPGPKTFFELRGSHDEAYIDSGPAYLEAVRKFLALPTR